MSYPGSSAETFFPNEERSALLSRDGVRAIVLDGNGGRTMLSVSRVGRQGAWKQVLGAGQKGTTEDVDQMLTMLDEAFEKWTASRTKVGA